MTILLFFVILTGVIVVHELGHFLFAKLFKMRVLEFAVGFGPKIFAWEKGGTVYRFNVFPIGGYVKLEGEDVFQKDFQDENSFSARPAWQRFLVTFAGPLFSILAAYLILAWSAVIWGFPEVIIGAVDENMPAGKVGMMPGDRIVKVNDRYVLDMGDFSDAVSRGEELKLLLKRGDRLLTVYVIPEKLEIGYTTVILEGRDLPDPSSLIDKRVESLGGFILSTDTFEHIKGMTGRSVELVMEGKVIRGRLVSFSSSGPRYMVGIAYATFKPVVKREIGPFKPGDRILRIGDMEIKDGAVLSDAVTRLQLEENQILLNLKDKTISAGYTGFPETLDVVVLRNGETLSFALKKRELLTLFTSAGVFEEAYSYWKPENPLQAMGLGVLMANELMVKLLEFIGGIFSRRTPAPTFVGPIGLVGIVAEASKAGLKTVMLLVALITLNLGIINLLPLPALDGGRMTFAFLEMVTRRRLPPEIEAYIHMVGFLILMILFIVISIMDVRRLMGL